MAQFDLPIDQLRAYRPELAVPADLDAFWADTLRDARSHDLGATFTRVENHKMKRQNPMPAIEIAAT